MSRSEPTARRLSASLAAHDPGVCFNRTPGYEPSLKRRGFNSFEHYSNKKQMVKPSVFHCNITLPLIQSMLGMRTKTWTKRKVRGKSVYSIEEKRKAVQLYIDSNFSERIVINNLGYPSPNTLRQWHREYMETGTLQCKRERRQRYS